MHRRSGEFFIYFGLLALMLLPRAGQALPQTASANEREQDAQVFLTMPNAAIRGDARTRCTLRFVDASNEVKFKA
ncbi:MAG: hypothetical protein FJ125_10370, partial [Deltaproteobacteria bacterium]|nr:hypothetical protein [Deltaproteobacteria bacterium]